MTIRKYKACILLHFSGKTFTNTCLPVLVMTIGKDKISILSHFVGKTYEMFMTLIMWIIFTSQCSTYTFRLPSPFGAECTIFRENWVAACDMRPSSHEILYTPQLPMAWWGNHNVVTTHLLSIERADWPKLHDMFKARDANVWQREFPVGFPV